LIGQWCKNRKFYGGAKTQRNFFQSWTPTRQTFKSLLLYVRSNRSLTKLFFRPAGYCQIREDTNLRFGLLLHFPSHILVTGRSLEVLIVGLRRWPHSLPSGDPKFILWGVGGREVGRVCQRTCMQYSSNYVLQVTNLYLHEQLPIFWSRARSLNKWKCCEEPQTCRTTSAEGVNIFFSLGPRGFKQSTALLPDRGILDFGKPLTPPHPKKNSSDLHRSQE
jgi:hypothetical protein